MVEAVDMLSKGFQETERIIVGVKPEQMSNVTPCANWNVRALLNHTVEAIQGFATCAAGGPPPIIDFSAAPPDIVGDDPTGAFRQAADAALAAWSRDGVMEGTVRLPPGELPGNIAIGINLLDTYIHAWDIAKATGQDFTLDPKLAAVALETLKRIIGPEARRPDGPFGPEVPIADNAPVGDTLIAFTGRQP